MSRTNTRIQNFTRVTELADNDVLIVGPASGDRAKGITKANLEAQFEGDNADFSKQVFTTSGTILDATTLAVSTGINTLVMPLTHTGILTVKSISGDQTLDPGVNTVENGNTVLSTTARSFNLNGTVWLEVY